MYRSSFGLNRRPFSAVPQVDQYFPAATIEAARTTLARCIQRGEGAGLVIGPAGTGKTLLCLLLAEQCSHLFQVAMLNSGRLSSRRALFQAILYELGRAYRGMDEGELRLAVVDYLMSGDGSGRGMVLLVDEAQTLPLRLLDEIRLLSNLSRCGQPLVRLVLAGAPALEERLANPRLDSLNQRLSARCYLEPLSRTETKEYIESQITSAGGQGELVFLEATCQCVFQATGGVVRLVNQVCDHALLLAYVAGRKTVEPACVEEAWADLQQLPSPTGTQTTNEAAVGGVIEFGSLDDSSGDSETAPTASSVFRVAGVDDEETPPEDSEPAKQIHRIEQLLAETEDDFQPAGTIGPEVELCFDEAHPFREEFEQEEVVSDRYAAAWRKQTVSPTASVPIAAPVTARAVAAKSSPRKTIGSIPTTEPTSSWECQDTSTNVGAIPSKGWFETPANPPQQNVATTTATTAAETNVAVVDEELHPTPAPQQQQYRQLFARLRRG